MEIIGKQKTAIATSAAMLEFCGQERCIIDGTGRLKLSTNLLRDYQRHTDNEIVLYCLPEGAIVAYPPSVWQRMRGHEANKAILAARSVVYRRTLRRFGAMSQGVKISNQGRITIPSAYREYAKLVPNTEVLLIGCEIGVEIWNAERWLSESQLIQEHIFEKVKIEMDADLLTEGKE